MRGGRVYGEEVGVREEVGVGTGEEAEHGEDEGADCADEGEDGEEAHLC